MASLLESSDGNVKNYSTINGQKTQDESSPPLLTIGKQNPWRRFIERHQGFITAFILFVLGIVNMADRYIVSSVLIDIQRYFRVSKATAGLLQTIYLLSFMVFSPLSGYLGDRFNRKYILIASILIWIGSVVAGSFVTHDQLRLFAASRIVFGAASALFETVGVPIIGDRFHDNPKTRQRAILAYTVGPGVGIGFAYFVSLIAKDIKPDDWRFSMRITPFILVVTLLAIILAYVEPERARNKNEMTALLESPELDGAVAASVPSRRTTFLKDLKVIFRNKTFILLVTSWTAGLATVGAVAWWQSSMIEYSLSFHNIPLARKVALKKLYSLQQALCGIIGLTSPVLVTTYYKRRRASGGGGSDDDDGTIDCWMLAAGFFLTAFFLYVYLVTLEVSAYLTMLIAIPMGISFSLSWISGFSIFLEIMPPPIRATALSTFFFVLHSVGDSISPYWVGVIAEKCINNAHENAYSVLLDCTRMSYYPLVYLSFFAGALGLFASLSFRKDKQNALNYGL